MNAATLAILSLVPGSAPPPFVGTHAAIDTSLGERRVTLHGVADGALLVTGAAGGAPTPLPIEGLLALTPVEPIPPPVVAGVLGPAGEQDGRPDAVVRTANGQRLWLELLPAGPEGALEGRITRDLRLSLPLDSVLGVSFVEDPGAAGPAPLGALDDRVLLANGDAIEGFVVSIGPRVSVDVGGVETVLDASRVARVDLATPSAPAPDMVVTTRDGWVVASRGLGWSGTRVLVTMDPTMFVERPDGGSMSDAGWNQLSISLERLAGFWRRGESGSLAPLAGQAVLEYRPVDRRWSPPPEVGDAFAAVGGLANVTLPGPVRVAWSLPAGATRFATTAELVGGPWGACRLTVAAEDAAGVTTVVASAELAASGPGSEPSVEINAALPAGGVRLVVTVEPGALGPIQDRVRLVRPRLLVPGGG